MRYNCSASVQATVQQHLILNQKDFLKVYIICNLVFNTSNIEVFCVFLCISRSSFVILHSGLVVQASKCDSRPSSFVITPLILQMTVVCWWPDNHWEEFVPEWIWLWSVQRATSVSAAFCKDPRPGHGSLFVCGFQLLHHRKWLLLDVEFVNSVNVPH